jgi:hypothetical protein
MGGITKGFNFWFSVLRKFFFDKRVLRGEMSLGYGDYELVIETPQGVPSSAFISVEEPDDANMVCMGSVNLAGAKLLPGGFILYARVRSAACVVKWVVEFETGDLDEEAANRMAAAVDRMSGRDPT